MTEDEFEAVVGRKPKHDDLDRANCKKAGEITHSACGVCPEHKKPRFVCGCVCNKQ